MELSKDGKVHLGEDSPAMGDFQVTFNPRSKADRYKYTEQDHAFLKKEFPDYEIFCPMRDLRDKKSTVYARLGPRYMGWLRYITRKYNVPQDYVVEKLIDQVRADGFFNLG